jgi:ABC-2 type transport system permease protein
MLMSLMIDAMYARPDTAVFSSSAAKIAVVDQDQSDLSKGLIDHLSDMHTVHETPDEARYTNALKDHLFNRNVEYIIVIPDGFERNDTSLNVTKIPGTMAGFYVDQQVNDYVNGVRVLEAAGYDTADACKVMSEAAAIEPDVTILTRPNQRAERPGYSYMFAYMPYIIMCVMMYTLGYIRMEFGSPERKRRMLASAVSSRSRVLQILLGNVCYSAIVWALLTAAPFMVYRGELMRDPAAPYYILNTFTLTLMALSMTMLIGSIARNPDAMPAIVNVLSLGMSFLCGVFIPLEMLSGGVVTVARFLPVYWFVRVNHLLAVSSVANADALRDIFGGMAIVAAFTAGMFIISTIVDKARERDR